MPHAYEAAGVSVEAGYEVVKRIASHVDRTTRPGVVGGIGGFGGLFDLASLGYREPMLVSGTDGVGTKLMVAKMMDRHDTIGIDCVAMCANDIAAQGAEPLFFLDYIACGKNKPAQLEQVVSGVADGCVLAGCALIGGETAEMPGMYDEDEYDLAGFCVGVAERSAVVDGSTVREGDALIGLPSSGIHSNGFSLARKALFDQGGYDVHDTPDRLGGATVGDTLLTPTTIYVHALRPVMKAGVVKGVAHITGGGFIENIPRMIPQGLAARITLGGWPLPPIFDLIERAGSIDHAEMFNVFNMGIGMVLAVDAARADEALALLKAEGETAYRIGSIVKERSSVEGHAQRVEFEEA
ncbi:phosphoribosylformylglycinamidine cyclo-ligase [Bifidobacterium mongoliense]|uniref:phosphoribosylformylglycinamidine cyclo-ligase n=1 Tax=Bifidobacterium mongoliense TaxID=518643 RepID=UPI0026495E4E|nr:phosphoribosylformylglycinamidine cyclo-ligase [Bifidobacterium mongoliense]MDN6025130.1 phosphoribosylformylglycinamidine cyclo-ligase [Bifidobacterium mongoliense]MDN6050902.1 phosphoribosylformylglycinamidine cyclo-ligase [Bifidobacterium mongoliense]MDN6719270.1 phosphoribosylformylglycinamidine cyclo-ligase [Bifidobacterium mongoliense]